jgi:putative hydrolase
VSINQEIADSLREIATLLEEQGAGPFRVNAYQRAASTVVNLDEPISEIVEQKGLHGLIALPGIGEGIARSIYEYVAMGRMSRLESLRGGHDPVALFNQIPGVGSTLAHRIIDTLHIDSLEALEVAAYNRRLEKIPGFSTNKVAMVQAWLAQVLGRRRPEPRAHEPVAEPPVSPLLQLDRLYREKAEAGELPTPRDLLGTGLPG